MESLGYVGNKLGQFKDDTGKSNVLAGLFTVRKGYFLVIFDGDKVVFKSKMKGLSNGLRNNPALQIYKEHHEFIYGRSHGHVSRGLITTTTSRKPNRGIVFKTIQKQMRRGNAKTGSTSENFNIRVPFDY